VLIRLRAIGLNRADLGVAAGHKHGAVGGPGADPGPGGRRRGREVGAEVPDHFRPGMRVNGVDRRSYAEYAVTMGAPVAAAGCEPVPGKSRPTAARSRCKLCTTLW
jgi:NADPH:quinone reductase-like Zn-dependent oxidoreductase